MTSTPAHQSTVETVPVVLGLGGNVGDVKVAFAKAIQTLAACIKNDPTPVNPSLQADTGTSGDDQPRLQPNTGTSGVTSPIRTSRLYTSSPWGVPDQPDFLNMAVAFPWTGSVESLFNLIRWIERDAGRHRPDETRWGPRRLDIDILVFGEQRIEQEALTVPHPRLHERRFVLLPLLDLLPGETILPGYQANLNELLAVCPDQGEVHALGEQPWYEWRETQKRS